MPSDFFTGDVSMYFNLLCFTIRKAQYMNVRVPLLVPTHLGILLLLFWDKDFDWQDKSVGC